MHYNALAAKGIIRSPMTSCSTRDHSVAAAFAENGIGREWCDGNAQRERSVIYDGLVCVWQMGVCLVISSARTVTFIQAWPLCPLTSRKLENSPHCLFMAAVWNRAGHYIFVLFLLLFSSPNLSGNRLDVYHTSTHGVNLECRSEMCCTRLAGNAVPKNRHLGWGTITQLCRAISS